jgi:hypothetical protein
VASRLEYYVSFHSNSSNSPSWKIVRSWKYEVVVDNSFYFASHPLSQGNLCDGKLEDFYIKAMLNGQRPKQLSGE